MSNYAIVLHGGAVTMKPGELSPEEADKQREGLRQALHAGWQILHHGGTALDAVEAAVRSLEDNEHFNAGRGSSLTLQGEVEMDAAIMDGRTLQAGAVNGVKYVQNPISLARAVMERCPHVYLSGDGAIELALECHLPLESPNYFLTEKTKQQWLEIAQQDTTVLSGHDTVGAVALDQAGNGEVILRGALAHEVYALVKYKGLPLAEACQEALKLRDEDLAGDKGFIAIDPQGNIALEFNTNVMRRAYRVGEDEPFVAIYRDE
jgi:beta-aspartyl-peptidase (threonine type)